MGSKRMLISFLLLRLLTLSLLMASIAVLVTDKVTFSDDSKTTFKDVVTYRYVVATSVIGFLYTLFQTPFALFMACKEKRMIQNQCFSQFDFFGDKVITFLAATGAAAGFAVTTEFKKFFKAFPGSLSKDGCLAIIVDLDDISKQNKFFDKANIANGLLFLAALSMLLLSIFSSINRTWLRQNNGFFSR